MYSCLFTDSENVGSFHTEKNPINNVYALIWCDILNGYFVDNIIIKDVATPDLKGHGHDFFFSFFFTF